MKNIFLILSIVTLVLSCNKPEGIEDNQSGEVVTKGFTKEKMLENWADNFIIPSYGNLVKASNEMKQRTIEFTSRPTQENLKLLRSAWKKAYIAFEQTSLIEVSKAASINNNYGFTKSVNSYPANIELIESFISKDNYSSVINNNMSGFPAIDYMINAPKGYDKDEDIVNLYSNNFGFKKYLNYLSTKILDISEGIHSDWVSRYRNKYVKNKGIQHFNEMKLSINYFVKSFFEYQLLEKKIHTPVFDRQAHKVEAVYAKELSKELLLTSLKSGKDFFNGTSFTGKKEGYSLRGYLEHLKRDELAKVINDAFNVAIQEVNGLEDNFVDQINNRDKIRKMRKVYNKIFIVQRLLKVDMMSAFNLVGDSNNDSDND